MSRSATVAIGAVTTLVSLAILLFAMLDRAALLIGFVPARLSGLVAISPAMPVLLTPFSATLVHGSMLHLLFNLVVLGFCGLQVERVLGAGETVVLYLAGAFVAAIAHFASAPESLAPMVGASGAISALVGAYSVMFGRAKRMVASPALNRAIHVVWLAVAWIVIQWMTGYVAGQQGVHLAVAAHIGGFLAGLALQRPLLLWRYRRA